MADQDRVSAPERRYEIEILVGPCHLSEAEDLADDLAEWLNGRLGAAIALGEWKEPDVG